MPREVRVVSATGWARFVHFGLGRRNLEVGVSNVPVEFNLPGSGPPNRAGGRAAAQPPSRQEPYQGETVHGVASVQ